MATGIVEVIKRASLDAVKNNQMCDLRLGTVVSTSPLKVQVTNQFTIPEKLLIVPQNLKDYSVRISEDGDTPTGEKTITIHNALRLGDRVALLRKTGGQSYYILDRI